MMEKGKKKVESTRLWIRFDKFGKSKLMECERSTIIKRVAIPSRDLRSLTSVSSHPSNIRARERAMVVQLEFIKAIVTADEVLILDPLCQEVIPFVDQLRRQLAPIPEAVQGLQCELELPFEFRVLEVVLEFVWSHFNSRVEFLERDAYPSLDQLAENVNKDNLQHVRILKSNLTHVIASVQKVRDEIEHLLDDDEDMANLYLTRKLIHNKSSKSLCSAATSNSITRSVSHLPRYSSCRSGRSPFSAWDDSHEDLEMLLEAYFIQLEGMHKKLLSVRDYIDNTKDYINIHLDHKRNELINIQLILRFSLIPISLDFAICGALSMNIPCVLYDIHGIFEYVILGLLVVSFLLFLMIIGYVRWRRLFIS